MKDGEINSLYAVTVALFENTAHTLLHLFTETNLEKCSPEFYIYEIKKKKTKP